MGKSKLCIGWSILDKRASLQASLKHTYYKGWWCNSTSEGIWSENVLNKLTVKCILRCFICTTMPHLHFCCPWLWFLRTTCNIVLWGVHSFLIICWKPRKPAWVLVQRSHYYPFHWIWTQSTNINLLGFFFPLSDYFKLCSTWTPAVRL